MSSLWAGSSRQLEKELRRWQADFRFTPVCMFQLSLPQLTAAARAALAGGASGVSLFNGATPSEEHWKALKSILGRQDNG